MGAGAAQATAPTSQDDVNFVAILNVRVNLSVFVLCRCSAIDGVAADPCSISAVSRQHGVK